MASLSSLRSELNYWNDRADDLGDKLRKLKRRKSDVEAVRSSLKSVVNHNSDDVNRKLRSTADELESAVSYPDREAQLAGMLSGKDEADIGGDGSLSSADDELAQEISDISRKIGDTDSALTDAKNRVRSIRSEIAAEERRRRAEAARKAAEAAKKAK